MNLHESSLADFAVYTDLLDNSLSHRFKDDNISVSKIALAPCEVPLIEISRQLAVAAPAFISTVDGICE